MFSTILKTVAVTLVAYGLYSVYESRPVDAIACLCFILWLCAIYAITGLFGKCED